MASYYQLVEDERDRRAYLSDIPRRHWERISGQWRQATTGDTLRKDYGAWWRDKLNGMTTGPFPSIDEAMKEREYG